MSTRRYVELTVDLAVAFYATTDERGHVGSAVLHQLIVAAARGAREGWAVLPSGRAQRGSPPKKVRPVRWTQGAQEYDECVRVLHDHGSSVAAVLREGVQAYVDCGGDLLAMNWPARKALAASA